MIRSLAVSAALVAACATAAAAQSLPDAPPAATAAATPGGAAGARGGWAKMAGAFALRRAYREIAQAEVAGGSSYLDAAKSHYRDAIARYQRDDAGAAAAAAAAAALARASIASRPLPAPRDIPTPPALAIDGGPGMMRRPMGMDGGSPPSGGTDGSGPMRPPMPDGMDGRMMPPPGFPGRPMMGGPGMGGPGMAGPWRRGYERFDAARVAAAAQRAGTPEAKDLAQKAVDADVARTRAAFAGNVDDAMRQERLADALSQAVSALAAVEHPRTFQHRTPGIVGTSSADDT